MPPTDALREKMRQRPAGRSPAGYQTWQHLLFLHWEFDPQAIQKTLPPGLYVDTYEGKAYLGVVPFYMRNIRPRFCPTVPGISNFLELNVRTYVYDERGIPGVWFYSLDANLLLAVWLARAFFHLPYHHAKMKAKKEKEKVTYYTKRYKNTPNLSSSFSYSCEGPYHEAELKGLEFFLLERYILFAYNKKKKTLSTGQVVHSPYQVRSCQPDKWDANYLEINDFSLPQNPPDYSHISAGVDVEVFAIQNVLSDALLEFQ